MGFSLNTASASLSVLNLLSFNSRFPWYDLEEDKDTGTVLFRHDSETTFTPEELLGMILNHSRSVAEKFAGELCRQN